MNFLAEGTHRIYVRLLECYRGSISVVANIVTPLDPTIEHTIGLKRTGANTYQIQVDGAASTSGTFLKAIFRNNYCAGMMLTGRPTVNISSFESVIV